MKRGRKEMNILLVEDNTADADFVSEVLREKVSCRLSIVQDGEKALAYFRGQGKFAGEPIPDIVLLDLNLPKISGREVLRTVKADADLRRIPILVFTSSGAERDIVDCYNLNANCYIQKPSDLELFGNLIDALNTFWVEQVRLPPTEMRRKSG